MNRNRVDTLVNGLTGGDALSLARLISWAENQDPRIGEVLRQVYPRTGSAHRIGITGPPGAGKSTLIARLALVLRDRGARVAVVAVDPTSPFTGGALLGDRFRMTELSEDPGVFMRSMASRGSLGGLAAATEEALDLVDAAGYDWLLVETVGVGQIEMDIAAATDTVVVVLVPESGDGIQTMKAGLLEIGDIFVVNKADREGADRLEGELESMLDFRPPSERRPPVLATDALSGAGLTTLADALVEHRDHGRRSGVRLERRRRTLRHRLLDETRRAVLARLETDPEGQALLERVERRELTPHDAAERWMKALIGSGTD